MNEAEKQVMKTSLNSEKKTLEELKKLYNQCKKDCKKKIQELSLRPDFSENMQTIIYQKKYQDAILGQVEDILQKLQDNEYDTLDEYIKDCYDNGYVGTMYSLQQQGIPLVIPIDQKKVVQAIQIDSKLSKPLYRSLGENITRLKNSIRAEVSRGIVEGKSWIQVGEKIAKGMNTPFDSAMYYTMRIARTEGHRVQEQGVMDSAYEARDAGAEQVKQWDSALDSKVRNWHKEADGQIREIDEPFDVGGEKLMKAGDGSASNAINCRCHILLRAKWALDEAELETMKERATFFGLDKSKDFEDFKNKYMVIDEEDIDELENETANFETLRDNYDNARKAKDQKEKELSYEKINLSSGNYQEQRLSRYSEGQKLAENPELLQDLEEKASKAETTTKRLEEIGEEKEKLKRPRRSDFDEDDDDSYYKAREEYLTKKESLLEEEEQLWGIQRDAYIAKDKLRIYENYKSESERLKKLGVLTKQELIDKISQLEKENSELDEKLNIAKLLMENHPDYYTKFYKSGVRTYCEDFGVEYMEVKKHNVQPTMEEIIKNVGGGDMTQGSCASLGFAYAGQRNGLNVLDFRDGKSRTAFASHPRIKEIANLKGVVSKVMTSQNPMKDSLELLSSLVEGKEYYFTSCSHASIVRLYEGKIQYLELQSGNTKGYTNGWHDLDKDPWSGEKQKPQETLNWRFGIKKKKSKYSYTSTLIEVDSLKDNKEFELLLGYINTEEVKQRKSSNGTIK